MILTPREYQTEAREASNTFWDTAGRRGATVLPTGMGKTVIFAHMCVEHLYRHPLILVHRDELIGQAAEKLHSIAPDLTIGVIKAGRNEIGRDVTIASVQTLSRINRLSTLNPKMFGLIIVDEAHHAAADTYVRILKYFGGFEPGCGLSNGTLVAGFSATLSRNDSRGLGDVWQKVTYKKDILWGIRNKFLSDVKGKRVVVEGLDLSKVRKTGKDFSDGALGEALHSVGIGSAVYQAYVEHAPGRQAVAFLPTVATAYEVAEYCHERGVRAACVTGGTSKEDRNLIYKMVRANEIDILVNCMVLTEGFDIPQLDCVIIARPTQSAPLYVQMVGRGMRMFPGKEYCLVLDLVGASEDNRLATLADLSESLHVKPRDGESLDEAKKREEDDSPQPVTADDARILSVHDIDLFSSRTSAWLRTDRGYWFIPAGQRIYAVLPEDSAETRFTVGYFWNGMGQRDASGKLAAGVSLEYGMAWAESEADSFEPMTARSGASWRKKKREPATDKQMNLARRVGVPNPDGMTKVELSDAISIVLASNRIDRWEPENA